MNTNLAIKDEVPVVRDANYFSATAFHNWWGTLSPLEKYQLMRRDDNGGVYVMFRGMRFTIAKFGR